MWDSINDILSDSHDSQGTIFRDVVMLGIAAFMLILGIIIVHMNPEGEEESDDVAAPGNVIVEVHWPDNYNTDVDGWVMGPDGYRVGYSNRASPYFNLLRDDLGYTNDVSGINLENFYSRGIKPGEHVVNVHLYSNTSHMYPVPVKVVISIKAGAESRSRQILTSDVVLTKWWDEVTVFRFSLKENGELIPDSVYSTPINLAPPKPPDGGM